MYGLCNYIHAFQQSKWPDFRWFLRDKKPENLMFLSVMMHPILYRKNFWTLRFLNLRSKLWAQNMKPPIYDGSLSRISLLLPEVSPYPISCFLRRPGYTNTDFPKMDILTNQCLGLLLE